LCVYLYLVRLFVLKVTLVFVLKVTLGNSAPRCGSAAWSRRDNCKPVMPSVQIFFSGSMQDRARSYTSCTIRDQDEQLRTQQQAVAEDPIFAAIERHKTAFTPCADEDDDDDDRRPHGSRELRTAFMRLTLAWLGSGFIRGARA